MKKYFLILVSLFVLLSSCFVSCGRGGDKAMSQHVVEHEYVDLGLPSGTKWATCNVGASRPEEFGGKYAWGETKEKLEYSWSTYELCGGEHNTIKKYCVNKRSGKVDNRKILDLNDDVAYIHWGANWRMPTMSEFDELRKKCTWEWICINDVYGYVVTGPNGNNIFLPATEHGNYNGYYWSSFLGGFHSECAFLFNLTSIDDANCENKGFRYLGCSVRPVLNQKKVSPIVDSSVTINGFEYVNLGLSSGLKWATRNIGANSPEEYGGYYAWGETDEKVKYDWSTYKWCMGSDETLTKYCSDNELGKVDDRNVLELADDVANVKWGASWRMPTIEEQKELLNECFWVWTELNGANGYSVTGPNGNCIFLPATGYRSGCDVIKQRFYGYYWSSSVCIVNYFARFLEFSCGGEYECGMFSRCEGRAIRPVSK